MIMDGAVSLSILLRLPPINTCTPPQHLLLNSCSTCAQLVLNICSPQGSRLAALYNALAANRALSAHLEGVVLQRLETLLDKNWAHTHAVAAVPSVRKGRKDPKGAWLHSVLARVCLSSV